MKERNFGSAPLRGHGHDDGGAELGQTGRPSHVQITAPRYRHDTIEGSVLVIGSTTIQRISRHATGEP
jgi:hypothetical protein